MKIAISGSTGLIGAAAADRLAAGHQLVRLGRGSEADVRVDLSDPSDLSDLSLDGIEAFVHCAGIVDGDFTSGAAGPWLQSTASLALLIEAVRRAGARRFVYVSTAHVYGHFVGRIDEESRPDPISDYAIAHFAAEQIIRRGSGRDFSTLILRPCAVFGVPLRLDRFDRWSLIPYSFPLEAVTSRRIVLRSSGEQRRNFIATCDIAEIIARFIDDDRFGSRILNPVGGESCSVYDFARRCAAVYTRLTGEACEVARPASFAADPGATLDYTSIHEDAAMPARLGDYIEEMISILMKQAKERRLHGS